MIIESEYHPDFQTLDYKKYRQAHREGRLEELIAAKYGETIEEVRKLSSDPDHGGRITISSLLETMVAFQLEQNGVLGCTVMRGPSRTDLKDGWGRKWDVKTPPYIDGIGFNEESAIDSVLRKLDEFPSGDVGILLNISFLKKENYLNLQEQLQTRLTDSQKFLVRQVVVEGVIE